MLLTRAMSGNYVNFGVFVLYGDRALSDCLEVIVKLCLCMPLEDILAYTKVCKAYFTFLELLMRNHTATFIELDTPVIQPTEGSEHTQSRKNTVICTQS